MHRKLLQVFTLLSLLHIVSITASAQMRKVAIDTNISNNNIKKISFYSASQGWLAGYDDAATWVAHTTDSGRTLSKKFITSGNVNFNGNDVNLSFGFDIAGVKAISQNSLIAYGDYGLVPAILYSNDAGNSFTLVYHSQYNDFELSSGITDMVFPENNTTGFATDADRILKTTDGGQNWLTVKDDPQSFFENIEAINNNTIFAYSKKEGSSKLVKSLDGGAAWQELPIPFASINSANFITATKGWLNGLDAEYTGLTYYTSNGGFDWQLKNNAAITPYICSKMKFINDSTGFALGELYTVFKTTDSGKVWEPLPRDNQFKDAGSSHNDLFFINNNQFWAAGYRNFIELNTNPSGPAIPKAFFSIDTAGVAATGLVKLINYSKNNYQFKWYVNNQFLNSNFNTTYPHNSASAFDSVKLVATSGTFKDSVTKYQFFTAVPPIPIPKIDSFTPASNYKDFTVTIYGSNFIGINTVKFGNVYAASFKVISPTIIKAVVGNGSSGSVTVSNNNGSAAKTGFVYITRLKINSFTPVRGPVGTTVIISGTNFSSTAAENIVYFGTVKAVVFSASSSQLAVQVPAGITYMPISVTVNGATAFSNLPFTVTYDAGCSFSPYSFAPRVDSATFYRATTIGASDLDGDGKPDIVTGSNYNKNLAYQRNTSNAGSISFENEKYVTIEADNGGPGEFCISDIDGDGKQDISAINGNYPWGFSVVKNKSVPGNISFDAVQQFPDNFNNRPKSISTEDFDGDGKPEMIGLWNRGVYVYKNNSRPGLIAFSQPDLLISNNSGGEAAGFVATDVDGDGRKDIVVSSYFYYNRITIFKNKSVDSSVIFDTPDDILYGTGNSNKNLIAAGDIDNDNKADLVTLNMNANSSISILRNTSTSNTINFTETLSIPVEKYPNSFTLGDINGDGKTDIILCYNFEISLTVLLNTSSGSNISFAAPINLGIEANPYSYEVLLTDLDRDGKQDIASISYRTNGTDFDFHPAVVVYRNNFCENNSSSICPNEATSFRALSNGNTFQWQQDSGNGFVNISNNGIFGGTGTNQLTLTSPPTSWYGFRYRCLVNGVPAADTFTIKFAASWLGTASNAWENPLNWGCGGVPDGNTDVLIPSGSVQVNANADCRSLYTNFGVSVNVIGGVNLKVTH